MAEAKLQSTGSKITNTFRAWNWSKLFRSSRMINEPAMTESPVTIKPEMLMYDKAQVVDPLLENNAKKLTRVEVILIKFIHP